MLEAQKVLDEYWRRVVEEEKERHAEACPVEGFERVRDRETWCCTTAFCSNGMLGCGLHVPGGSAARVRPPQGKPPGPQPGDYRPCRCRG